RVVDGYDARERFAELDHDAVAVAEHRRVRAALELRADRVVQLRHTVAERVDPQRRDGVEIAPAVDVDQLVTLGALDDDWRVVGVRGHLREPVPHARRVAAHPVGALHRYSETEAAPRSRRAPRIFSAAASRELGEGFGSARANDSSPAESNGTTCTWTCGT